MKKLLFSLFALLCCTVVLASCGKDQKPEVPTSKYTYHAVGGFEGSWKPLAENKMELATVAQVKEVNAELGSAVEKLGKVTIAMAEVELGTAAAGWDSKAMINDKVMVLDGSRTVKVIRASYDAEDELYTTDQWISDPKTGHCESLTPSTLWFPAWQEAKDDNGFSWSDNPCCIGKAGVYTLVIVDYGKASSAEEAGFGMALVLKEEKTPAADVKEPYEYVAPAELVITAAGDMNGWKNADEATTLTKNADGTYEITLALEAGQAFKFVVSGSWDLVADYTTLAENGGCAGIVNAHENRENYGDNNFDCTVAGSYKFVVTVTADGYSITVSPVAAE